MARPQQPELARSGRTDLDPDRTETELGARKRPRSGGNTGPVPPENEPGHHPEDEQDKPDLDAFAAKLEGEGRPSAAEPVVEPAGDVVWPESAPASESPGPIGQTPEPPVVAVVLFPLRAAVKGLERLERQLSTRWRHPSARS